MLRFLKYVVVGGLIGAFFGLLAKSSQGKSWAELLDPNSEFSWLTSAGLIVGGIMWWPSGFLRPRVTVLEQPSV